MNHVDDQVLVNIPDPEPEPIIDEIRLPPEEEIIIEPVVEELKVVPPPQPAPKKKSKLGLIILLLLLLGIAGVAAYYFLNKNKTEEKAQSADECSLSQNKNDELAFIQNCLKTKPDSQRILAVINQAKAENKCAIAQRLYARAEMPTLLWHTRKNMKKMPTAVVSKPTKARPFIGMKPHWRLTRI